MTVHTSRGDAWRAQLLDRYLNHQCGECGHDYDQVNRAAYCTNCGAKLIYLPWEEEGYEARAGADTLSAVR